DERELQRILEFKRQPRARIGRLVRASAIVGAFGVLIILFVQMPAGRSLMNRARLVASPTAERTADASIEPHSLSVVEAPAPPSPARIPAEHSGRSHAMGRARTEVVSPAPNPQFTVPPPASRRPLIAASSEPTNRPATAPEPIRPTHSDSLS